MNQQNLVGTSLPISASEVRTTHLVTPGMATPPDKRLLVEVESLITALSRLYLSEVTGCCRKDLYEQDRVDVTFSLSRIHWARKVGSLRSVVHTETCSRGQRIVLSYQTGLHCVKYWYCQRPHRLIVSVIHAFTDHAIPKQMLCRVYLHAVLYWYLSYLLEDGLLCYVALNIHVHTCTYAVHACR